MMDQDELIVVFVEESVEHLASIEPDLLEMEEHIDRIDADTVNRIFRAVHSIKGAAGFFGFSKIGDLAHIMENLLSQVRDGKMTVTPQLIDSLLTGLDTLRAMLDDVNESEGIDTSQEMARLSALMGGEIQEPAPVVKVSPKSGEEPDSFDIKADQLERFVKTGNFLYTVQISLRKDLKEKDRTPLDLVNTISSCGELIESRLVYDSISGLSDCLENDIFFVFAFATIMDVEMVCQALDITGDQVGEIDIQDHQQALALKAKELLAKNRQKEGLSSIKEKYPAQEQTFESHPTPAGAAETVKSADPLPTAQPQKIGGQTVQVEEKFRIGISFLNELVNLAGEMVLGRNQLSQIVQPLVKDTPGLSPVIQHISRITTEMQGKIMQMRMQPVSNIFGKFHRVVRDLAKKLNKEIGLTTYGEEVELDRSIIEALSDPLTHLIRNSVDHGIELPSDRDAAGKPRQGNIELRAYHQAGHVYIDIIDDGAGIDCPRVGEKAVEKGLITREKMEEMGERELARLIFKPGFSTAAQISDVSGRGVGMDVVLTNIAQIGGTVDIDTRPGLGTTISLVLPLTLAIVSGLVIRTSGQCFVLPEANIDELVRIKPEEVALRINRVQNSQVLRLRDMLLPLISLDQVLQPDDRKNTDDPLNISSGRTEPMRVLIIKHGISRFGLLVDEVDNIEEIVVKPLPRYLEKQLCFSGASIMGNGDVALILDVAGMFEKAGLRHISLTGVQEAQSESRSATKDQQTLLLFNNGSEERFAMPLEQITRIERVQAARIEKIKDRHYLQYQGDKLRLVFLEDYLPVDRPDRSSQKTFGVIIPKQVKHPMGIVINHVEGTIQEQVDIDTKSITAPGLFGSAILEGKITLLPDMYRLFELAAPEWYDQPVQAEKEARTKRILIVEDTPFFRMIEKDFLTSAGFEVIEAENGKQAIDLLNEERVDAVIMDVVMPVMDGWEAIQIIRNDNRFKTLPVMAVTSLGSDIDETRGLEAGFDLWESKLNKERLLEKLTRMLDPSMEVA